MSRAKKAPREPKRRPRPAFDGAVATVTQIFDAAKTHAWSSKRLRLNLRERRTVCPAVWRQAIRRVIGTTTRDLPDLRQLSMFGDG